MADQSLRTRKNGTLELRFRFNNRTVSVYGKTQEECMYKKRLKLLDLYGSEAVPGCGKSVAEYCLCFCEQALENGSIHEEGYKSLLRTARFIGRSRIGVIPIDELDDGMIDLFKLEAAFYSEHTIKKALHMLMNIRKGNC